MNKNEFLSLLRLKLGCMHPQDIDSVCSYYEEIIEGAVESGKNEYQAVADLGPIIDIINNTIDEYFSDVNYLKTPPQPTTPIPPTPLPINREFSQTSCNINLPNFDLQINCKNRKVIIKSSNYNTTLINYKRLFLLDIKIYSLAGKVFIQEKYRRFYRLFITLFITCSFLLPPILAYICAYDLKEFVIFYILFQALTFIPMIMRWIRKSYNLTIHVPPNTVINNCQLNTTNGTISIYSSSIDNCNLKSKNGAIKCDFSNSHHYINTFSAATNNGSIKLTNCLANTFVLYTKNGHIKSHDLAGANLQCGTKNGSIKLEKTSMENIELHTRNGNIKPNSVRATNITLICRNGNIVSSYLGFTNLSCRLKNGNIKLDNIEGSYLDYLIQTKVNSSLIKINHNKALLFSSATTDAYKEKTITSITENGRIVLKFEKDNPF